MLRLKWSKYAIDKYDEQIGYIALRNPTVAEKIADKIEAALSNVAVFPEIGRKGRCPDTFEYVVSGTPLIIIYGLRKNTIIVFNILHSAQDYP